MSRSLVCARVRRSRWIGPCLAIAGFATVLANHNMAANEFAGTRIDFLGAGGDDEWHVRHGNYCAKEVREAFSGLQQKQEKLGTGDGAHTRLLGGRHGGDRAPV